MLRVAILVLGLFFSFTINAKNEYKQWNKANQLFFEKQYEGALKIYHKLESKHQLKEFQLQIARCYFFTNKKISALPWYEKVIDYPNINIDAYKEYAQCLELKKRDVEALAYEAKYNALKSEFNSNNILITPVINEFTINESLEKKSNKKEKTIKTTTVAIDKKTVKDSIAVSANKLKTEKTKKSKKSTAIEGLYYNIYLGSFLKDPSAAYYYDIESLGMFIKEKFGENTIYYIGKYKNYETAEKYFQKVIEAGYTEALIQPYYNNKKIDTEQAKALENKVD